MVSGGSRAAHPEASFKPFILRLLPQDAGDSSSEGPLSGNALCFVFLAICVVNSSLHPLLKGSGADMPGPSASQGTPSS